MQGNRSLWDDAARSSLRPGSVFFEMPVVDLLERLDTTQNLPFKARCGTTVKVLLRR